jgi:pimeloyl-ACP methyl ester carboxylesterase
MGSLESLYLAVGESQAHYLKGGQGTPVVLVHGGASDSRDWADTIASLSDEYSLYAPDLVGYGESASSKDSYYLTDFVSFMSDFIHTLGLDTPVLVGHSLGGRICLEIALTCPGEVSRLVLVDSAGFGAVSRGGNVIATALWRLRRLLKRPQPYPTLLQEEGEAGHWSCMERCPQLRVPTLLVWKRHDPYFPVSLPLKAKRLIPDASLVVLPGYGHAPHRENPDLFARYLRRFLEGYRY